MRILIVKLSSIGDVVHTLPAVAMIRRLRPDASLTWVVDRPASTLLAECPVVDSTVEIDTRRWRSRLLNRATLVEIQAALKQMRGASSSARPDLAIDFQGLLKSALVTFASRAPVRAGFRTPDLREKAAGLLLTDQVDTSRISHVIDKNLALARGALRLGEGVDQPFSEGLPYEFPIQVSRDDEDFAVRAQAAIGERFAIINPGGGWPTKRWPAEQYGELADQLLSEFDLPSLVTFGPGEQSLAESVVAYSSTKAARAIASSLKQFVALARRAALFVGGDTGPLHLATASGTPVVGLYGPTSPERNGPFSRFDIVVGRNLWCRSACHRRRCWHWECLDIPLQQVTRAVAIRLGGAESRGSLFDRPLDRRAK